MTATNSAIENNRVAICIIVNDDCNESFTCEWTLSGEIGEVEVGSILEAETNIGTAEVLFLMQKEAPSDTNRKKIFKKTNLNFERWCWTKSMVEEFRDRISSGEYPIEEYPWIENKTFVADCTVRHDAELVRLAYCVHIDEPNEYISKIYSWELPDEIKTPSLGDYISVENRGGTADVVFLFERNVVQIEPIARGKVLAISEYKHSDETNLSLLKKISSEILRGTHATDDFLGAEDGVFLGWRTPVEEQDGVVRAERRHRRERIADREYASQLENFFGNLQRADDLRDGEWYLFNPRVTNEGRGEGEVDIVLIRKNCRNEPFIAATAMCGDTSLKGGSFDTYWGVSDKESIVARSNGDGGFVAENRGHFYILDRNIPVRFRLMTIGEVIESLNITFEETPKPLEKTDLEFEVQLNNNYKIRLQELKLEEGVVNVPTFHKRHDTNFCSTILAKEVIKHLADDGKIYTAQVYERGGWYHLSGITQMNMVMPLLFNATRDMREAMGESYITAFHNLCDKGIRFGRYFYKKEVAYSPCKCCDELHTLFSLR